MWTNKKLRLCAVLALHVVLLTSPSNSIQASPAGDSTCPSGVLGRFGVNVHLGDGRDLTDYDYRQLNIGHYLDYSFAKQAGNISGVNYVHVIRTHFDTSQLNQRIGPVVDANPGAIWIVGNEPDRIGQDGVTAAEYADFYHAVYGYLKGRDPSAQVAIAGVVQPTALRLAYLDAVLTAYEQKYGHQMPVDVFNTHAFVMSEKIVPQNGIIIWGASIPPGMGSYDQSGNFVEPPEARYLFPSEAWNIEIFKQQLRDLRAWMAAKGYRNKPLMVSEYGILLPDAWDLGGVTTSEFMVQTFDFMLTETDSETGYPGDENRLVQWFFWFSLNFPNFHAQQQPNGLNGALFNFNTGAITELGETYKSYTSGLMVECDIALLPTATALPPTPVPPTPQSSTSEPSTPEAPTSTPTATPIHQTAVTAEATATAAPSATSDFEGSTTSTPGSGSNPTATPDSNPPGAATPTPTRTAGNEPASNPSVAETPVGHSQTTVGGTVWYDYNRNQVADPLEITLAQVKLDLIEAGSDGLVGTDDDAVLNQWTDASGRYAFTDVQPGQYQLSVDLTQSLPDPEALVANGNPAFTLSSNLVSLTFDFPIRGRDYDLDGIPDVIEGTADFDGDGLPNFADPDSDEDSVADSVEGLRDRNGNGAADYLDIVPVQQDSSAPVPEVITGNGPVRPRIFVPIY